MTPAQLSSTVLHTVRRAVAADELYVAAPELPQRVVMRRPPRPGCGDYATNVALQLAGPAGRDARDVAAVLRRRLVREPGIARVDVAGPGFLNITLEQRSRAHVVAAVLAQRGAHGRGRGLRGAIVDLPPVDPPPGQDVPDVRALLYARTLTRLVRACGGDVRHTAHAPRPRPVPFSAAELAARLGPDAARWALLRTPPHDAPRLDPGPLLAQRESNPLFRVRYAHARTRALLRGGHALGITPETITPETVTPETITSEATHGTEATDGVEAVADGTAGAYEHPAEADLLDLLDDHPRVLEAAARHRAPDRLARHLLATADAFFRCHDTCPPLPSGEQKPLAVHRSRLALADAAGTVLADGLHLLGVSAPDHL